MDDDEFIELTAILDDIADLMFYDAERVTSVEYEGGRITHVTLRVTE